MSAIGSCPAPIFTPLLTYSPNCTRAELGCAWKIRSRRDWKCMDDPCSIRAFLHTVPHMYAQIPHMRELGMQAQAIGSA